MNLKYRVTYECRPRTSRATSGRAVLLHQGHRESRTGPPRRYRAGVFPLSGGCSAFELGAVLVVRAAGLAPAVSTLAGSRVALTPHTPQWPFDFLAPLGHSGHFASLSRVACTERAPHGARVEVLGSPGTIRDLPLQRRTCDRLHHSPGDRTGMPWHAPTSGGCWRTRTSRHPPPRFSTTALQADRRNSTRILARRCMVEPPGVAPGPPRCGRGALLLCDGPLPISVGDRRSRTADSTVPWSRDPVSPCPPVCHVP